MSEPNSIEWHKECLSNNRAYAIKLREEAERAAARAENEWQNLLFYAEQIDTAVLKGKEIFDRERFMIKKRLEKSMD